MIYTMGAKFTVEIIASLDEASLRSSSACNCIRRCSSRPDNSSSFSRSLIFPSSTMRSIAGPKDSAALLRMLSAF